jgi:hypothetical protein
MDQAELLHLHVRICPLTVQEIGATEASWLFFAK